MAFQGTITCERGRIVSLIPSEGEVVIRSEAGIHTYPNAFAYPGFVDSHLHIFGYGMRITGLSFYEAQSAEECCELALQHSFFRGSWLVGMGWNQELWKDNRLPTKELLDYYFPTIPVFFTRVDGHAAWVNSVALRLCGITASTENPHGGIIGKDASGKPNGILIDTAMELVRSFIPDFTYEQKSDIISASMNSLSSLGLTEVHDLDVYNDLLPIFRDGAERGILPIRVQSYVQAQNDEWIHNGLLPAGGELHRISGVKYYIDGAIGSRGALLFEPYSDDASTTGIQLIDENLLYDKYVRALEDGWQLSTHAIGDKGNSIVLKLYSQLREEGIADNYSLLRIEHAQNVIPTEIELFQKYDIRAAIQPIHCISDAFMAEQRLTNRCSYAYPWKSLLDAGVIVGSGSDAPIESPDPRIGLDALVHRIPFNSTTSWYNNECISMKQAIDLYTRSAHSLSDVGYRRGELQPKFDADISIFDTNFESATRSEILNASVVATYVAGSKKFSKTN